MSTSWPESPVPADERLTDGELPFTAFGQWGAGRLDLRVFDQDTYWVDYSGKAHLLDQMSEEYHLNVIGFLSANAEEYFTATLIRALLQWDIDSEAGYTTTLPGLNPKNLLVLTASQWLESTPLMLRLRLLTGT